MTISLPRRIFPEQIATRLRPEGRLGAPLPVEEIDRACRLFKVLANRRRLAILLALGRGERTVSQLVATIGLQQPAVSQHLAELRAANIVGTRRVWRTIHYRIVSPSTMAFINALAAMPVRQVAG